MAQEMRLHSQLRLERPTTEALAAGAQLRLVHSSAPPEPFLTQPIPIQYTLNIP